MNLKILFIGDIVGKLARQALTRELLKIKKSVDADLIIANGENATHGHGITDEHFQEILKAGVDVVTLGDHAFDRKESAQLLEKESARLVRPANYPHHLPGKGETVFEVGSRKVLIISMLGRVFMKMHYDDPLRKIDEILEKYKNKKLSAVIVDFHAEATSEKNAFSWYVDGRVSAVLGTHTHVPTADAKILPAHTAHISDVGMVGARDSIIGAKKEMVLKSFKNQIPGLNDPEESGVCQFNSVIVEINPKTKRCVSIQRLDKKITM